MVIIDQSTCAQKKALCSLRKAYTETELKFVCPWAASSSGASWACEEAAPLCPGGRLPPAWLFSDSLQPEWVALGQINSGWLEPRANPSACELVQEPRRGARQLYGGEGCWTLVRSADDALIQFPNSILHLGYADREYPAAKQKKSPNLHVQGFAPVSLQPRTSSVSETGLQLLQAGKAQRTCQARRVTTAET